MTAVSDKAERAVATLMRADPQFVELAKMLYGPGVAADAVYADVFGKMNPASPDMSVPGGVNAGAQRHQGRRKLLALAALGTTAAGGVVAAREFRRAAGRGRLLPGFALAGDALATGELYQHLKTVVGADTPPNRAQTVQKVAMRQLVHGSLTQHRRLVRETLDASKLPSQDRPTNPDTRRPSTAVRKRDTVDADWVGEFSKINEDKRLALGWASICKVGGLPIVDRQGDYVDAEDLEDAVYRYVERSRIGGDMHDRAIGKSDGRGLWFGLYGPTSDNPRKVADLVESVIITKAKKDAMGLPESFPEGWWVGFRYHDDEVWDAIKKGERTGFSIHGAGLRKSIDYDALMTGAA